MSITPYIPEEIAADDLAILEHITTRKALDPLVKLRIHQRAERIREDILRRQGVRDIAVELIRQARDQ